jgi:hypothetical protein
MFTRKQIIALVIVAIALDVALMSQVCKAEDYDYSTQPLPIVVPATPDVTYNTYGNQTYGSDGSVATQYGTQTYITQPTGKTVTCTSYGTMTVCN